MIKIDSNRMKWYGLFALATLLGVCAGVMFYMWPHNFPIRLVGLLLIMIGVYLLQKAAVLKWSHPPAVDTEDNNVRRIKRRTSPLLWAAGIVLLVLWGLSFLYLYIDAINGYHNVLPVYLFTGVGLANALFWGLFFLLGGDKRRERK